MGRLSKQPYKDHSTGSEVTNQTVLKDLHDSCLNQTMHLFATNYGYFAVKWHEIVSDLVYSILDLEETLN